MGFMSLTPKFRVLRAAGVALLPVVAVAVCPDRAAAECGNYVTVLDDHGRAHPPTHADQPMPKAPCNGPNCSGAPKAPAPVPPAPTGPTPDAKVFVGPTAGASGDDFAGLHPPAADGITVCRPYSIFHPPRAA